jgi:hypothetical protein
VAGAGFARWPVVDTEIAQRQVGAGHHRTGVGDCQKEDSARAQNTAGDAEIVTRVGKIGE